MNITEAGVMQLTDAEGSLLTRPEEMLSVQDAQVIRQAVKIFRKRRFRMLVRCDACFEAGRGDGMRGEISPTHISLECRCRWLKFNGATL